MPLMNTTLCYENETQIPRQNEQEIIFEITAFSEPSTLPRILENFALRNLVPHRIKSEKQGDQLHIAIAVHSLPVKEAKHLQLRMKNIMPVLTVGLKVLK